MSQLTEKTENVPPNRLVSLKILVCLFFGALQCMYAFLPHHMIQLGFKLYDVRLITLISALVSIIGPLIVGFILDRVSIKRPSAYGKWLRVLLFIFFILAGLLFGSLLFVPKAAPAEDISNDPAITFACNDNGGHVFIKKNVTGGVCQNLEGETGNLKLINCSYTCETPENFNYLNHHTLNSNKMSEKIIEAFNANSAENPSSSDDDYDESAFLPEPQSLVQAPTSPPFIPPPHICVKNTTGSTQCHVYLDESIIRLKDLVGDKIDETYNNTFIADWCMHPLSSFTCHVPEQQVTWMKFLRQKENSTCVPAIECLIEDPYVKESILSTIERTEKVNETPLQYDLYVTLRIIAEIFPVIIHMLLNISIIIATRETSVGRGNIGHQWAFYPIGVLIFATVIGLINHCIGADSDLYFVPILTFSITMFLCAIVVLFSGKLPLTPNDWWWHTKCGMLAIPMSALKRYKWVIAAIAIVAFILGGLWHVLESFRHIVTLDLIEYGIIGDDGSWCSKTFVYVIGAILAIPLIWNGEKIVDCFGHSNIFILAFVSFALRFAGLYFDYKTSFTTLYEILEPISFYLPWLALILFTRHLVPKRCLAVGQGLLVILFFALGRAIGFFFGTSIIADDRDNKFMWETAAKNEEAVVNDYEFIFTLAASISCVAAILYFTIYHCILLPRFRVPTNRLATNNDTTVSPQRVFHDERSRKGYFRY